MFLKNIFITLIVKEINEDPNYIKKKKKRNRHLLEEKVKIKELKDQTNLEEGKRNHRKG